MPVSDVKINTDNLKLEEGASFQLNAIVLPNDATNKDVIWKSSNPSIVTVSNTGLIRGVSAGAASVSVESVDGNKKVLCNVTVNKKTVSTRIKLDDISREANEFNSYDTKKIYIKSETPHPEYYDESGHLNEYGKQEEQKTADEYANAINNRARIFNSLINNKKSFVLIYHTKNCDGKPYLPADGAKKVLGAKNIPYLVTYSATSVLDIYNEPNLVNIEINEGKHGSVIIVKNGSIYASIDPNADSIKNDDELKNWLSKYIEI